MKTTINEIKTWMSEQPASVTEVAKCGNHISAIELAEQFAAETGASYLVLSEDRSGVRAQRIVRP